MAVRRLVSEQVVCDVCNRTGDVRQVELSGSVVVVDLCQTHGDAVQTAVDVIGKYGREVGEQAPVLTEEVTPAAIARPRRGRPATGRAAKPDVRCGTCREVVKAGSKYGHAKNKHARKADQIQWTEV